jgi:hypothetical protein
MFSQKARRCAGGRYENITKLCAVFQRLGIGMRGLRDSGGRSI